MQIKLNRIIHKGWTEYQEVLKQNPKFELRCLFGKYQYIYESDKGMISLVLLKNYGFKDKKDVWEIYELSANKLFDDVERFRTKTQALKRIKELLK